MCEQKVKQPGNELLRHLQRIVNSGLFLAVFQAISASTKILNQN